VFANVFDCDNIPSPGVTLSISPADPDTKYLYFRGGSLTATVSQTDSTGVVLIGNVPVDAGTVTVTATPVALGRPSSVVQGFVRAGTITEFLNGVAR
jgi:hypothetical protein